MTRQQRAERLAGYAPLELTTDPTRFGLASITVTSAFGSCVAFHRPERTSARATIFLHGAAGSWTTWTPLLETASSLGVPIVNPVVVDLPGWGGAELTSRGHDHSIEAVCELVKSVAEELGYTEWDLVGHSLGGFVALHMAAIWPHSVMSIGMVSGSTFSVISSVNHPVRNFFELPGFTMLWRAMQFLAAIGSAGRSIVRALGTIGLLRPLTFPLFRHWNRVPRSQGRALGYEIRPQAFATAARVTRGYDPDAQWHRIECPVRATKGDRDVFVRNMDLERLRLMLRDVTAVVIRDCGHFGNVERPREILLALGFADPTVDT